MDIYSYFNSATSFRLRIALELKGLAAAAIPINLRAGAQRSPAHRARNPSAGVPVLVDGDFTLSQSLAIIDYLDAQHPTPRLIPQDNRLRARVLEVSLGIACDIHPVNNLRVLQYLKHVLKVSDAQKDAWYRHWIAEGLHATETLLSQYGQPPFCFGEQPTLADCCLVPQIFNAQRMGCDISAFTRILAVHAHCMAQAAFQRAQPKNQVDFVAS